MAKLRIKQYLKQSTLVDKGIARLFQTGKYHMGTSNNITRSLLLATILLVVSNVFVFAQEARDDGAKKILAFLDTSEELRNYAKSGYTSTFSSDFRPIPTDLATELSLAFPEHKFAIAKMKVSIEALAKDYDLIVISDAIDNDVEGFIWGSFWVIRPSNSFGEILKGHRARSKDEAVSHVTTFAKLIAFTEGDKVGKSKFKNGKVKVELIRGEGVMGVLEVEANKNFEFGRLTITGPHGKRLRHFV